MGIESIGKEREMVPYRTYIFCGAHNGWVRWVVTLAGFLSSVFHLLSSSLSLLNQLTGANRFLFSNRP